MEKNTDIATGFTTYRAKEDLAKFWKKTETELNSLGPPIKSISDWKKVWLDKKKYIRNKMSENIKNKKATGGGQFKEHKFSRLEETIIRICSMKDSIEGCRNASSFGLPSCSKKRKMGNQDKENVPSLQASLECVLDFDESHSKSPVDRQQIEPEPQPVADDIMNSSKSSKKRKSFNTTNPEYLEQELSSQKEICTKIGKAVDFLESHQEEFSQKVQKIYRSIDRLYDQQKLMLKEMCRHNIQLEQQKQQKFEEIKRHNNKMENLRLKEIESKIKFKEDLIQIEEEKLRKMQ
ncbi:uncharacterized protein LOC129947048 [Eupeodes corollae]|uniref:uncharacterized protein LOC129947048 n=1 Tax=Eupeodes corollae TaxID=290404 RepID=UPI0024919AAE|nr:uncharacterized protein LOC129947048 [Eupeodes corollae]